MPTRANLFGYWIGAHVGIGTAWGMINAIEDFEVKKRLRMKRHLINDQSYLRETGSLMLDVAAYGVFGAMIGGIIGGSAPISYLILGHHLWTKSKTINR
jgi:hypothetical protein